MTKRTRRWWIPAAAGLWLVAAAGWCVEPKIGVVDMERALKEFYKAGAAQAELERQKDDFKGEIQRMQDKLKTMEREFEAARQETENKALNETALAEKYEAAEKQLAGLKEYERDVRKFAEQRKKELLDNSLRMRKRLVEEIGDAVAAYARKKGLLLVLDSSEGLAELQVAFVVYRDASIDVTEAVIEALNKGKDAKDDASGGKASD